MHLEGTVVMSGAPGTGKSTIGSFLADALRFPFLSLDVIKETLGDQLGTGDEDWSDLIGDTAAEVVFRLTASFPAAVVEGWWRKERRERALQEFQGCVEIFCRCDPALAETRMRSRHDDGRHAIHRDVINPHLLEQSAQIARSVAPLGVGAALIEIDTTAEVDRAQLLSDVRTALQAGS